jgi:hypothetical protein
MMLILKSWVVLSSAFAHPAEWQTVVPVFPLSSFLRISALGLVVP